MNMIKGLIDRVIFASGVLLFMQVPHFIDQYEQRLGGYYQAQVNHLEQFQNIADKQHDGDLTALINDFANSNNISIQQTAINILRTQEQTQQLQRDVEKLSQGVFTAKLVHVVSNINIDIARAVVTTFKPAFPFSIEGFVCGLFGGIFLSVLFNGVLKMPRLLIREKRTAKESVKQHRDRIEPRIMNSPRSA